MRISLPKLPRSSDGLFIAFDMRAYARESIEFDRLRTTPHHIELRRLAQEVVDAFAQPDDYKVPQLWIVKLEALRDHLKRAP